jgi:hypothetical protein
LPKIRSTNPVSFKIGRPSVKRISVIPTKKSKEENARRVKSNL